MDSNLYLIFIGIISVLLALFQYKMGIKHDDKSKIYYAVIKYSFMIIGAIFIIIGIKNIISWNKKKS